MTALAGKGKCGAKPQRHGRIYLMGLVYTVSTCREPLNVIERFVRRNVAAGADHLFIFLDEPDGAVSEFLDGHSNVTGIVADERYWGAKRPENVNSRQKINANLIRVALAATGHAAWLFHIDADETLQVERSALDSLPAEIRAVRLRPLEAVSTDRSGWEGRYKRLLDPHELALLHTLGVIPQQKNSAYFHGHHIGKVGIRPSLDVAIEIHYARDAQGSNIPLESRPEFNHTHDASLTPGDFISHWTRHALHSEQANFKPAARLMRDSFRAILDAPLSSAERRELMLELYRRTTADEVDLLHRLGYLVDLDQRRYRARPAGHTPEQAASLGLLIDALLAENPNVFRPAAAYSLQRAALGRAGQRVAEEDPALTERIRRLCSARAPEVDPQIQPDPSPLAIDSTRSRPWPFARRQHGHSRQKIASTTRRARRATR
jgi:hypothetical protein